MKVTSMKGRQIDINALREQNGASIALGNANMNARGDILGRGGIVVKSKEQVVRDYYENNPKAVTVSQISLKSINDEVSYTPAEAIAALEKSAAEQVKPAPASKRRLRDTED